MRVFLAFFALLLLGCGASVSEEASKKIIIPQYFYDFDLWKKVIDADIGGYVIINPSNGPGESTDSAYLNEIHDLIRSGKTPVGYVYTKWSDRSIDEVKEDIDTWLKLYPEIKGFFIDECSNSVEKFPYYEELKNYIKAKGDYKIVLNPGTQAPAVYYSISDTVVSFEGAAKDAPDDLCAVYPSKSAAIIYDANESFMREALNRPCEYFYITDDNDSNPYDTLPSYFDEEIELLK